MKDHVMQFFAYEHLPTAPKNLQAISKPFCELAKSIVDPESPSFVPQNQQRTIALNKLVEAKDAAVRAAIAKPVE